MAKSKAIPVKKQPEVSARTVKKTPDEIAEIVTDEVGVEAAVNDGKKIEELDEQEMLLRIFGQACETCLLGQIRIGSRRICSWHRGICPGEGRRDDCPFIRWKDANVLRF